MAYYYEIYQKLFVTMDRPPASNRQFFRAGNQVLSTDNTFAIFILIASNILRVHERFQKVSGMICLMQSSDYVFSPGG